jgi:hypothetical protein
MVQSWQNFMSPTGGYTDNTFQFGLGSILTDIGLSVVGVSAANSMISSINSIRKDIKPRTRGINRMVDPATLKAGPSLSKDHPIFSRTNRKDSIFNKRIDRLKNTKWALKGVGYSYLAMGAAQIFESMLTPNYGITSAAKQSDANIGQGPLDSGTAYTQRQRALMAIHDSQLGISSVIGNESQYFHR